MLWYVKVRRAGMQWGTSEGYACLCKGMETGGECWSDRIVLGEGKACVLQVRRKYKKLILDADGEV